MMALAHGWANAFYASAVKGAKALYSRVVLPDVRLSGHYFHRYNLITAEANSFISIPVIDLMKV